MYDVHIAPINFTFEKLVQVSKLNTINYVSEIKYKNVSLNIISLNMS